MMSYDSFLGEHKIYGFNFAPLGYMSCVGQTTFGLPDLQGRFAKGEVQGPGLPSHVLGQVAGATSVSMIVSNLPAHTHPANGITANLLIASAAGTITSPVLNYLAQVPVDMYATAASAGKNYSDLTILIH